MRKKFTNWAVIASVVTLAIFISCRKTSIINEEMTPQASKATFYQGIESLDPNLTNLVSSFKKQKSFNENLAAFIKKNGIPVWEKTRYKTVGSGNTTESGDVRINSKKRTTSNQSTSEKGLFYIPLKSPETGEIQSYITATQHNDSSFEYRLYNRDSLDRIRPTHDTARRMLTNLEAVFAVFEKDINGHDSVTLSGMNIRNASMHFGTVSSGNKTQTNGLQTYSDVCRITITLTLYYEEQYDSFIPPHWVLIGMKLEIEVICWGEQEVQSTILPNDFTPGGPGGSGATSWWEYGTGWPWNNPSPADFDGLWGYYWAQAHSGVVDMVDINILENVDEDVELNPVADNQTTITFNSATDPWPTIANVITRANALVYDNRNCLAICKSQIGQKSMTDLGYSATTVYQAYERGNTHATAAKDGVDYIISKLTKGEPVIVGVDVRSGSSNPKTDATTDHFVTIVGSVSEGGKNYLIFYDSASTNRDAVANPGNRLEYNPVTGAIIGQTAATGYSGGKPYRVTQIRTNK